MKLGQVMSFLDVGLVPEEFREDFQAKLAELRDAAPKVSFKDMRRVVESEFDEPLDELFDTFDPVPIAAASIGQVYKARLHDGRDVAVKVQYPGVATAVRADMQNLGLILRLMKRVAPGLDPKAMARRSACASTRSSTTSSRPPTSARWRGCTAAIRSSSCPSGDLAVPGAGRRHGVRRRPRLRGAQAAAPGRPRPHRRDHLPLLLRLDVPLPPVLRRPAPGQLHAARRRPHGVPRLRPLQAHPGARPSSSSTPAAGHRGRRTELHRRADRGGFLGPAGEGRGVLAQFQDITWWYATDQEVELEPEIAPRWSSR